MKTVWLILPASLLLFGCGGGSSSGGGSASGTPTYTTLATLNTPTTFATVSAELLAQEQLSSQGPINTGAFTYGPTAVNAKYDPGSMAYTLSTTPAGATAQITQTFLPADIQTGGSYPYYNLPNDTLRVSQSLAAQPGAVATNFTYVGWAIWTHTTTTNVNTDVFDYGVATHAGDLPSTGTVTYPLVVTGTLAGQYAQIVGVGTLSVDFGAGTANLSLSPASNYNPSQTSYPPFTTLTGSGPINVTGNSFTFSITGTESTTLGSTGTVYTGQVTGQVTGLFYGPQGAEVGAAFFVNPVGTFIGAQPAVGVALGIKH